MYIQLIRKSQMFKLTNMLTFQQTSQNLKSISVHDTKY